MPRLASPRLALAIGVASVIGIAIGCIGDIGSFTPPVSKNQVLQQGECMCATCWTSQFCKAQDASNPVQFTPPPCAVGYDTAQPASRVIDENTRTTVGAFYCVVPRAGAVLTQNAAKCPNTDPNSPDDIALGNVNRCIDVPENCQSGQTLYGSCPDKGNPPPPACPFGGSLDPFAQNRMACGLSTTNSTNQQDIENSAKAAAIAKLAGGTGFQGCATWGQAPPVDKTCATDTDCGPSGKCGVFNGANHCVPREYCYLNCVVPIGADSIACNNPDPPFIAAEETSLTVDSTTSTATSIIVLSDKNNDASTQTFTNTLAVGGYVDMLIPPSCRGPVTGSVTCNATLSYIELEQLGKITVFGTDVTNMEVAPTEGATGQATTSGSLTTFLIPSGTDFVISSDIQKTGWGWGQQAFTSSSMMKITMDWSKRTFALMGTIYDATMTSSLALDLSGPLKNEPPRASAGSDQSVECTSASGTPITLSGATSTDADDGIASYNWTWQIEGRNSTKSGVTLNTTVPLGVTSFWLDVRDKTGGSGLAGVSVTSRDTTPPTLTVSASPSCLWPPDHKFILYQLGTDLPFTVTDACDTAPNVEIVGITSDQAVLDPPDFLFGKKALCLQAERDGSGDRHYTITLKATDASNNVSLKTVIVRVPHDQANDCVNAPKTRIVDSTDARCVAN